MNACSSENMALQPLGPTIHFGWDPLRGTKMSQEYRTAKSTAKCTGMKWKQANNYIQNA